MRHLPDPLPRDERAARYVAAMGGRDAVLAAASQAHAVGDDRWTAEILTHMLRLDPHDQQARQLKAAALQRLGYQTSNPIWRNNYLTAAKELDGSLDEKQLRQALQHLANPDIAASVPIPLLLRALATRLAPERSAGIQTQVAFLCTDTGDSYSLTIRSVVAVVLDDAPAAAPLELHASEQTLRDLLAGRLLWEHAINGGSATIKRGTAEEAQRFWGLFDHPLATLPALALR